VDWEDYDPAEGADIYRQLLENVLFCDYYWGALSAPMLPTIGVEFLFNATPELVDLIRLGWQPSPAVDVAPGLLAARYGKGTGARIAVMNPGFEKVEANIAFRREYWNGDALLVAREDGEPLNCVLTPAGVSAKTALAPRSIVLFRVCGRGAIANSGITQMDVRSERVVTLGRSPYWRFDIKTSSPIKWDVEFARDEPGCRLKIRVNDAKTLFKRGDGEKPVVRLVSQKWPYDYQSGARRSCLLESRSYPLFDTASLRGEIPKRLDPLKALREGALTIVSPPGASSTVRDEMERIREWFRFYSNATMKRYLEPNISTKIPSEGVAIVVRVDGKGLKKWQFGKCSVVDERRLLIVASDEKHLHTLLLSFLSALDEIYPYFGKLPDEKSLRSIGLAGKTLRKEKAKNVFHPTLIEMFKKTRLLK
jgi:hypothetical protein